ncbi:MAG: CidA/LrgA family protein [Rhizobiales bacterium]|nr:CidA/LrgA family protein [Hyphomicrobiales bacterium]
MQRQQIIGWLAAFATLAGCQIIGALLSRTLHLPVPGTVIGILLMLAVLIYWGRVPGPLRVVAEYLLRHLNLFYIPAAIGIMAHVALVRQDLIPIIAALFGSTFLSLVVGALVFQWMQKKDASREGEP